LTSLSRRPAILRANSVRVAVMDAIIKIHNSIPLGLIWVI
jgi:hypothetical protein